MYEWMITREAFLVEQKGGAWGGWMGTLGFGGKAKEFSSFETCNYIRILHTCLFAAFIQELYDYPPKSCILLLTSSLTTTLPSTFPSSRDFFLRLEW